MAKWDFSLSASKLNVFNECRRCFWLINARKVARADTPFPTLPNGIDRVLKGYADHYRGSLPPMLAGMIEGAVLWGDVATMSKLRMWQSGWKTVVNTPHGSCSIIGAFDDLLLVTNRAKNALAPLDWKTKGDVPKDSGERYYRTQGDIYALLIQDNGWTPAGVTYLCYAYPTELVDGGGIGFGYQVYEIESSAERAVDLITEACGVLSGPMPEASATCPHCLAYRNRSRAEYAESLLKSEQTFSSALDE